MTRDGIGQRPPSDYKAAEKTLAGYRAGELLDWEDVKGQLMTAPDRYVQGFIAGVCTVLVTGVVILAYLRGGAR